MSKRPLNRSIHFCGAWWGGVAGAGRVIEEERLVGRHRLGVLDELQRLVGQILGEVVAVLRRAWLVDRVVVVDQVRVPLVGLGA
jgi:hypothetical protein